MLPEPSLFWVSTLCTLRTRQEANVYTSSWGEGEPEVPVVPSRSMYKQVTILSDSLEESDCGWMDVGVSVLKLVKLKQLGAPGLHYCYTRTVCDRFLELRLEV